MSRSICGAVLAGGTSSRFGRDKALFDVNGMSMLDRSVAALKGAGCAPVLVVGGEAVSRGLPGTEHLADIWPDQGPLGAILTAMKTATSDWLAVLSCDLPGVTSDVVAKLIEARTPNAEAVLASSEGGIEPLVAVYSCGLTDRFENSFSEGSRSVRKALSGVLTVKVSFPSELLLNVNRPEDLDAC